MGIRTEMKENSGEMVRDIQIRFITRDIGNINIFMILEDIENI